MNDSQLIERLAASDLYPDEVRLPETLRADVVLLDIARRMEMDTIERTPVEAAKPPRRRWSGPLIAAAAFAVVIAVVVAAAALTNRGGDVDPANPTSSTTAVSTTAAPLIDTEAGAAALLGGRWNVVDGISFSRPHTIEFTADGAYRVLDAGVVIDTGVSTAAGEVITFESASTDEVTWVFNDTFLRVTDPCAGVVGQYRVVFTDTARATLEVVKDGCPPRIGVANGLVLEPTQP